MSNWTQAVCTNRWNMMHPDRPVDFNDPRFNGQLQGDPGIGDPCCFCRLPGCVIYIRIDPATVPYPQE